MPIHDWTRVDAGTFHAMHTLWVGRLMGALNSGLLPPGYYAMAEQVATRMLTDVLTLDARTPVAQPSPESSQGSVTVVDAPPRVQLNLRPDPRQRPRRATGLRRHVAIRHITGHRVIALIEIVSPSNKDRRAHVRELAEKVVRSLQSGIHVLVLDLLPAGRYDPHGMHGAVWSYFDRTPYVIPEDSPLTLASYAWDNGEPTAFVEPTAVGRMLVDMPLFLTGQRYINVPLERTYLSAYQDMPQLWREVLEAPVA